MQGGSATNTQLATRPHQISSFGEDEAGTIYVVNPAGTIFAISDLICDQGSGGPNTVPCTPQPATFRSATPATAGW
jgi:hypothetical protein